MAQTLTAAIRNEYPPDVRTRGQTYFSTGAVHIEEADNTCIEATVQGRQRYGVYMDWSSLNIEVHCDCPYFEGAGLCKHLWATALAYDAAGHVPIRLAGKTQVISPDDEDNLDYTQYRPAPGRGGPLGSAFQPPSRRESKPRSWKQILGELNDVTRAPAPYIRRPTWPADSQLVYQLDVPRTLSGNGLTLNVLLRTRKKDGQWSRPKPRALSREEISQISDPIDRQIAASLVGASANQYGYYGYGYGSSTSFAMPGALAELLLPLLCATGRCTLKTDPEQDLPPLQFDTGQPWEFHLEVRPDEDRSHYLLTAGLYRDQQREPLSSPVMLFAAGWIFWPDRVARLLDHGDFDWVLLLRRQKQIQVPLSQGDELLERILASPAVPTMHLPPELECTQVRVPPRPFLRIRKPKYGLGPNALMAMLAFEYDDRRVEASSPAGAIYVKQDRKVIPRDLAAEQAAATHLHTLGLRPGPYGYTDGLQFPSRLLPRIVADLVSKGWNIEADGALYRHAGSFEVSVSSGIDWFELHGKADFGGVTASLPQLLAALKRGDSVVKLDDGTMGIVPEEWLRKFDLLAGVATTENDHLRFKPTQAGFLDALLAAQPQVTCDPAFTRVREQLRRFERIEPQDPPTGFTGVLRPYQREGLGWLYFLQNFGFGGCLADDMGLGKTVQVLALLEYRRQLRAEKLGQPDRPGPSLAVVPRSLIFNWHEEAVRFTPALRVLDHTGTTRRKGCTDHFDDYDLVLTTYGTLRRDAAHLKDVPFDYVIFDESQAIKNAGTASAKAARLLKARHRLCLSGTPIENHLGELWSQFEVLNPGMLGASPALAAGSNGKNGHDDSARQLLARALRPFILRRTKSQVATDLPEKTEQTLHCELEGAQRKQYDELRDHYRQALLDRVSRDGINKSKIQILEALLRLRQAAIHPGLIDKKRSNESSAKLEALLPRLRETVGEGHKALVFSQFTTMLGIVRARLDDEKIPYEYLDGRTRDRQARVERFQTDPACGLFLISLKAGGLGLNLTAAEYVFLLDPWWNPAVEAQAVDRAHRIGQLRQVFAYRLIARNTVEDRIVELQQSKRSLADAIINADNSLIRDLSREDLELLLR